jgi:hypothetical protein
MNILAILAVVMVMVDAAVVITGTFFILANHEEKISREKRNGGEIYR